MKRLLWMLLLLLIPCAAHAESAPIVIASDLHYLSPSLVEDEAVLMRIIQAADGKLTHYTPQIAAAFVDEMLALRPEAVILSGDLTLNGSQESHRELIDALKPLQAAGIPVLVIPGNHDCKGVAYRFTAHGAQPVLGMSAAQFSQDYAGFGPSQALSKDTVSFSYVYALRPDLWLLMLDANTAQAAASILGETLAWAEGQLQAAQQAGACVIAVTHQNVLAHYAGFSNGFRIANADRLLSLLTRYSVRVCLSGHMHLQHISQADGLTEIATSALSVSPHHYGVITLKGGQMRYRAQPLDVAAWAIKTGADDPNLLDFAAYSSAFFDETNRRKLLSQLNGLQIPAEDKAAMMDYSCALNAGMFAGRDPALLDHSAMALWQRYVPTAFFSQYMQSLIDSVPGDMRQIDLSW